MLTTNWSSEFKTAFKDVNSLYAFLEWPLPSLASEVSARYPLFVPRTLAHKIKLQGAAGPLARQFLPVRQELSPEGLADPIGDKAHHKAPQLIHRYSSRVLFTPTTICPVHCSYCFRKNELNQADELFTSQFSATLDYLHSHPEIAEIIFTGGDPFSLSTPKLAAQLEAFAGIPHIKHIRFHSRYPVIMPERFDADLLQLLLETSSKFQTVTIAIHANHASEFGDNSLDLLKQLAALPLQLLSQTVLLRGVNDHQASLAELFEFFIRHKICPYYLHHPDRVKGGMHFHLPLEEGRRLYAGLRAQLPGWALPHYVIDLPGGEGKIQAFNPESYSYSGQMLSLSGEPRQLPEVFI